MKSELPEFVERGEEARLIPVNAESGKEGRAASILLASMIAVDNFAAAMLGGIGVRIGARAKVRGFTEVGLREVPGDVKLRPDGLLLVSTGKSTWSALIEAKIGKAEIVEEQLKNYLTLAKLNNIDAVITLSNQFTALPEHHPIAIPKALTKGVALFHWSWMHVLTQANLLLHANEFATDDQRYILREVHRHFSHDSAGVNSFDRMNPEWKDLVLKVQTGAPLNRSQPEVERSVASWHQEERDLGMIMSRAVGREVHLKLSRAHTNDQSQRLRDDCEELVKTKMLQCELEIPDAAAPLLLTAHLATRTITCAMKLVAPKDKKRSSARINWLVRQLSTAKSDNIQVKASWPGRAQDTQAKLSDVRANPACLEAGNDTLVPHSFEVCMFRDLSAKFAGVATFIQGIEEFVPQYYEEVGQHLRAWVPAPPKVIAAGEREGDGVGVEAAEPIHKDVPVALADAEDAVADAEQTPPTNGDAM